MNNHGRRLYSVSGLPGLTDHDFLICLDNLFHAEPRCFQTVCFSSPFLSYSSRKSFTGGSNVHGHREARSCIPGYYTLLA